MNLPISVLAVLCLSSFGRAQICDPTNMDFHCRGWKKANDSLGAELCYGYPDIGQLSFERGPDSANDCCTGDEVTGSTCNYPSYDSMMSECQQFCGGAGQSSVPVVVGSSTFGVDLSSATQLCLHPEITGGYDASRYERCESNADAIEEIEDASVSFLHKMRRFSYAVLEFKAGLLEQVDRIKEQIQDPDRLREIQDAARDQKILLIIEIYREALHTEDFPGKGALLRSVEDLKATANKLKEVMDRETGRLTTFLEECNGFFPKPDTFLRDVCKVTGPSCIDEDQGEHVSCCCFDNLVANMHGGEEFLDNSPPPAPGGELERRRRLSGPTTQIKAKDVCAEMYMVSAADVEESKAELKRMGHGYLAVEYEESLKEKYGKYYGVYEGAESSSLSFSGERATFLLVSTVFFWVQLFCVCPCLCMYKYGGGGGSISLRKG